MAIICAEARLTLPFNPKMERWGGGWKGGTGHPESMMNLSALPFFLNVMLVHFRDV